jgi:ribonuclease III
LDERLTMTDERNAQLVQLEQRLGFSFGDHRLLNQALTHASRNAIHYERLEFLGDAILKICVTDDLFHQFPEANEGTLSKLRARHVSDELLASVGKKLGLTDLILCDKNIHLLGQVDSLVADAIEALFAVCYEGGGLDKAKQFYEDLIKPCVLKCQLLDVVEDYKTDLQEKLQGIKSPLPVYVLISSVGPDHDKSYEVQVSANISDSTYDAKGMGRTLKKAEQKAAKSLLVKIGDRLALD